MQKRLLKIVSFAAVDAKRLTDSAAAATLRSMAAEALALSGPSLAVESLPAADGVFERLRLDLALSAADFADRQKTTVVAPLQYVAAGDRIGGEMLDLAAESRDLPSFAGRLSRLIDAKERLVAIVVESANGATPSMRMDDAAAALETYKAEHESPRLRGNFLPEASLAGESDPSFASDIDAVEHAIKDLDIYDRCVIDMVAAIRRGEGRHLVRRIHDAAMREVSLAHQPHQRETPQRSF
jgi:hypothetical protein